MYKRWTACIIALLLLCAQASAEQDALLKRGSKGAEVRAIQARLYELGFLPSPSAIDGDFGKNTEQAVKSAQIYLYEQTRVESTGATADPGVTTLEKPIDENEAREAFALGDNPMTMDEPEYEPDGVINEETKQMLMEGPVYLETIRSDTRNAREITRLQTRLIALKYLSGEPTGAYDTATKNAIMDFQDDHGLRPTGVAEEDTQSRLYDASAKVSDIPKCRYKILVSLSQQKVFVYAWSNGAYVRLIKTMTCSTGTPNTPTPKGSFRTVGPVVDWSYFPKYYCWARYLTRIKGPYLFHSVPYEKKDEATLIQEAMDSLGTPSSHGCVRLLIEDAKWIYDNCVAGTTVEIY